MRLQIELTENASPNARPVEIVERKGIGHPDTICDALAAVLHLPFALLSRALWADLAPQRR